MEKDWVKIFASTDFYKAEMVKQLLIGYEIDTVLLNKQDSPYGIFGEVEVYIHKEDFSRAIELMIQNETHL